MLKKNLRINSKYYFNKVRYYAQSHNSALFSPYFVLNVMPSSSSNTPSVCGVVVSAKISKKAVERNKIRRRLFSLCRDFIIKGAFSHGYFFVFYPKRLIIDCRYEDLKSEFIKVLQKVPHTPSI